MCFLCQVYFNLQLPIKELLSGFWLFLLLHLPVTYLSIIPHFILGPLCSLLSLWASPSTAMLMVLNLDASPTSPELQESFCHVLWFKPIPNWLCLLALQTMPYFNSKTFLPFTKAWTWFPLTPSLSNIQAEWALFRRCWGYWTEYQTGCFEQQSYFIEVLEAGSSRSRCRQVWFLWGLLPWLAGGHFLAVSLVYSLNECFPNVSSPVYKNISAIV